MGSLECSVRLPFSISGQFAKVRHSVRLFPRLPNDDALPNQFDLRQPVRHATQVPDQRPPREAYPFLLDHSWHRVRLLREPFVDEHDAKNDPEETDTLPLEDVGLGPV